MTSAWISLQGADQIFKSQLETFIIGNIFWYYFNDFRYVFAKKSDSKESKIARNLFKYSKLRSTLAVLFGVICGALVGATAIGGGVIVVPILIIVFGLSTSKTVGSAIFLALL